MNILIFSSKYPPQIGGVEDVVNNLSLGLSKDNDVLVVTSYNHRQRFNNLIRKLLLGFSVSFEYKYLDVAVSSLFMSLPRSIFGFLIFPYRFIISLFLLCKTIKNFKPSVINAHFLDDSLIYFYIATLFTNIPIVLDIHGNELHLFSKNKLYKYLFSKVMNKSKKIIVHSYFMHKELHKIYKVKTSVVVIPNSIDLKKFPKNTIPLNKKNYYLFVGRLDYKKGVDVLIKAYKSVEKKLTRKLIIIGGATGEKKHGSLDIISLKQLAKNSKIEFLGRVENAEVIKYILNAYYCVFPSRFEPFGIVALESVACGTPFLASSGGFVEISKSTGAGIIFKPGDITALSNLLLKVDTDLVERELLAHQGLNNISKYTLPKFLTMYKKELCQ